MISKVYTASLVGVEGKKVTVEVDASRGFPSYNIVGMAGANIKEAGYRVRSAIKNDGGYTYPMGRITVNLVPADLKKEGSHFDLPLAMGILATVGEVPREALMDVAVLGQLSLDGKVLPIVGALPLVMVLKNAGMRAVMVPSENLRESSMVKGIKLLPVETLSQGVEHLKGGYPIKEAKDNEYKETLSENFASGDYLDVLGQEPAKRAMVICAAGNHGILMTGSPGIGKTMLAGRLPTILPPMTDEEKLEVTGIYSVAGLLSQNLSRITERPFRSPHHTVTSAALLGGGRIPKPGEFTLAHRGVLFLDEVTQFERGVLDALRQPLEKGSVTIARNGGAVDFPGEVTLVAAANPCRCGFLYDPKIQCTCTAGEIAVYRSKISSPIMNRIDLHINLYRTDVNEKPGMSSQEMMDAVMVARERQEHRYGIGRAITNGRLISSSINDFCHIDRAGITLLGEAYKKCSLSLRSYHKVVKVARTIADLEEKEMISCVHIAEALHYRKEKF